MHKHLSACVLLPVLFTAAASATAQAPPYARPVQVPSGLFPGETAATGLFGGTFAPDGRLLLYAHPNTGWSISNLLPESVTRNAQGTAVFAASHTATGPWAIPTPVEGHIPLHGLLTTAGGTYTHPKPRTQFFKLWLSMCPDPGFTHDPCPYESDAAGTQLAPGVATHVTYQMLVFGADTWGNDNPQWGVSAANANTWVQPTLVIGGNNVTPIGMRRLRVTMPLGGGTPIVSISPFFDVLEWGPAGSFSVAGTEPVLGIEPSISRDGRLLVFQGNPVNQTRRWNTARTYHDHLMYTFNPRAGDPRGWSEPRPIGEMFANENGRIVDGVRFEQRYPIARARLTQADGTPLALPIRGAYPWMTIEATDIVFSARWRPGGARDSGFSIVGDSTGFAVRHVDGPTNPNRDITRRVMTTGTGAAPGMWQWGGDAPNLELPYTRRGASIPILNFEQREYAEVPIDDAIDGDYLLSWDMNELLYQDPATGQWEFDTQQTPDSSGNAITGQLSSNARFYQEWAPAGPEPLDASLHGISGQAIFCTDSGAVTANSPVLNGALTNLSAECWFTAASFNGAPCSILRKDGSFTLETNSVGQVRASVVTGASTLQSPWVGTALATIWRHAALTFEGSTGKLRVYVDGQLAHTTVGTANTTVVATPSNFQVGPGGLALPPDPAPSGFYGFDQVRLARVTRTADEMARAAFCAPGAAQWTSLPATFALPLGLDRAETKVRAGSVMTRHTIDLGDQLFHDPGLSGNGQVSCATCHIPAHSFTDQRATPANLTRNTPTVLNRLFSTVQFWDGRAAHLEAQALQPIFNPLEMNATSAQVMSHLTQYYSAAFVQAYGQGPNLHLLEQALATYQRALVAGNSPADRYDAGLVHLPDSERNGRDLFFGKARCFGCHSGSNFSDERFHVSVVAASVGDTGRFQVTRRSRDLHRFKTPTLRNLADTAPYFHDGRATTLAQVIAAYDAGGNPSVAVDEDILPLNLTPAEKVDLEAFLLALSGGWQKL